MAKSKIGNIESYDGEYLAEDTVDTLLDLQTRIQNKKRENEKLSATDKLILEIIDLRIFETEPFVVNGEAVWITPEEIDKKVKIVNKISPTKAAWTWVLSRSSDKKFYIGGTYFDYRYVYAANGKQRIVAYRLSKNGIEALKRFQERGK